MLALALCMDIYKRERDASRVSLDLPSLARLSDTTEEHLLRERRQSASLVGCMGMHVVTRRRKVLDVTEITPPQ